MYLSKKGHATQILKSVVGEDAEFHEGQWDSIEAMLNRERVLVVQKTGWGKSMVYFLSAKLLREEGYGPTIIISPLLSLMRNQYLAADKIGLKMITANSETKDEYPNYSKLIKRNEIDVIITTPEQLGNEQFRQHILSSTEIGMFVVDEAHCISDWGHDFRPHYRRITRIIQSLPKTVPVLATTATANDRVIEDISEQLGKLKIFRGALTRESLQIQIVNLSSQSERLAWLATYLPQVKGSGIVYCLTKRDCFRVSSWLRSKGINSEYYHADIAKEEKEALENSLIDNKIKVLVASTALGMGFDKPDISFVIHYQRPQNLIAYYQQIGRAGRAIDSAYAVLLCGSEDQEILEYFIQSAFPSEKQVEDILSNLEKSESGLTIPELLEKINIKYNRLRNFLLNLEVDQFVVKSGYRYQRTLNPYKYDVNHYKTITDQRYDELKQMEKYIDSTDCYMKLIANALDDKTAKSCKRCSNCIGKNLIPITIDYDLVLKAEKFITKDYLVIEPRKQWSIKVEGKRKIETINLQGICLSMYNDSGWGKCVSDDKYKNNEFRDELVQASYEALKESTNIEEFDCVAYIPSNRHPVLVKSFAYRLATRFGIPCYDIITKNENTRSQKEMENSQMQCLNAMKSFMFSQELDDKVISSITGANILLVDDIVDSRWTLTVAGNILMSNGANSVFPFALAAASDLG
jgi:ATP-dependent DNA helicase RecQ